MTGASILILIGLPAVAIAIVAARIAMKRRTRDAYVTRLLSGFEPLPHGCFRHAGRVFRLQADLNPLFSRGFSLRLSTFVDTAVEFEIRAARNVPTKTPQKLAEDPFYGRLVLDAPSVEEAVEHLLAEKEAVKAVVPARWGAYSRLHGEVALAANRTMAERLDDDLKALAALAKSPVSRRPRGGTWTIREGFEDRIAAWHWKPEQLARRPEGIHRICVSAWYDNAYLNAALAEFLWAAGRGCVVTLERDLWFLEHGFGRPLPVTDSAVELSPEMAVAGDQWLDGELFAGYVVGGPADAFRGALKINVLDRALEVLRGGATLFARRLFDDEFSWFSGEYELLIRAEDAERVRRVFAETAEKYGAAVKEIGRAFSFKLLKEDRLDLSF